MNALIELFGSVPLSVVLLFGTAVVFIYVSYRKFSKFIIDEHDREAQKDLKIDEIAKVADLYADFKQKTLEQQQRIFEELDVLKKEQEKIIEEHIKYEEEKKKREVNNLKDKLLQSYLYYADPNKNPSKSWTIMEKQAFEDLFEDYEALGGNGFMHTTVQPAMMALKVVQMYDQEKISAMMNDRT